MRAAPRPARRPFRLRHRDERELEIPRSFDQIRFDLAGVGDGSPDRVGDVFSCACQWTTYGGVAPGCLFHRNDLYSSGQKGAGFPSERCVPAHHDDRYAQIAQDCRVQTELPMRTPVQTQLGDDAAGNRVRMDRGGRRGHGVIPDADGDPEIVAIGAFQLAIVLGVAATRNQMRFWMQLFDQDIAHGSMTIVDQDVVDFSPAQAFDGRVDILGHEAATDRIVGSLRHHEVAMDDATDAFDISADEDVQCRSFL